MNLEEKIDAQIKILGDSYTPGFANGLTMLNSETMENYERTKARGIELKINKEKKMDALLVKTVVTNNGSESVTLEMLTSFVLKDMKVDKIYRMQSAWSAEGKLKVESITDLHLEKSWNGCAVRSEKFGNVGSMPVRKYFPFLVVEDEEKGEFTGVQLYIASSWQIELICKDSQLFTIAGGIADRDFGHWKKALAPGEAFEAPRAVVATGNSLLEVCDKLVKAQTPDISENDKSMGIMFNEYCTTWGNPTLENVKKVCDKLEGKGIDFLVIDSGWYGDAPNWWDMVGDWRVNKKRFPNGMKEIADYIKSKNMIPGLWYEMESVTSGAEQFNDTELLIQKDGYPLTVGNRRFWDLENPKAEEYLTKTVIEHLKQAGFGYLKVDYNDTMGMGCDGINKNDGQGENLRRKIEKNQQFFEKIKKEIPGIVIENCSSGGHRLEPSMMELCSQASFSDAHETTAIPIIAANLHRVIRPEQSQIWAVLRKTDTDVRIYYSIISTLLGRMCLSGDIYDLDDNQWKLVMEGMDFYRQVSEIIRSGKTIEIKSMPESYNKPEGEQLVIREWNNKRLVIFHRFYNSSDIDKYEKEIYKDGYKLAASYGKAEVDFSAVAYLLEK